VLGPITCGEEAVGTIVHRPARGAEDKPEKSAAVASRLLALHDGQQNLKSGAPSGLSDTVIARRSARTWSRTSARPRPVPRAMPRSWAARPAKERSKTCSRSSTGTPIGVVDVHRKLRFLHVDTHRGRARGVAVGVIDHVGDDPFEAPSVDEHEGIAHYRRRSRPLAVLRCLWRRDGRSRTDWMRELQSPTPSPTRASAPGVRLRDSIGAGSFATQLYRFMGVM